MKLSPIPFPCPSLAQVFSSAPYSQKPSTIKVSDQVSHPYKTTSSADNCALKYVKQVVGKVITVVERN